MIVPRQSNVVFSQKKNCQSGMKWEIKAIFHRKLAFVTLLWEYNLLVILFKSGKVLPRLRELSLLHALAHVPAQWTLSHLHLLPVLDLCIPLTSGQRPSWRTSGQTCDQALRASDYILRNRGSAHLDQASAMEVVLESMQIALSNNNIRGYHHTHSFLSRRTRLL